MEGARIAEVIGGWESSLWLVESRGLVSWQLGSWTSLRPFSSSSSATSISWSPRVAIELSSSLSIPWRDSIYHVEDGNRGPFNLLRWSRATSKTERRPRAITMGFMSEKVGEIIRDVRSLLRKPANPLHARLMRWSIESIWEAPPAMSARRHAWAVEISIRNRLRTYLEPNDVGGRDFREKFRQQEYHWS